MNDNARSLNPPLRPIALLRWLWQLGKDVYDEYRDDGIGDVAAAITFWTILSVPAAVLALVSALSSLESVVGASVAKDIELELSRFITDTFAESATLNDTVNELFTTTNGGVATIATLVALFTLSRAFAGLIRALDIAYEVEDGRPWWLIRLVAIGLGIGTVLIVSAGATVLAILPGLPLGGALRLLAVPAVLVGLVIWAATLFHVGPNHRTPWRYDIPGAIFTMVGWVAASQGFTLYVRATGTGNQVQSSVGAVLLALTLMYLLSIILLLGAELNDVLARRAGIVQQPRSVRASADSLRQELSQRRGR